MVASAAASVDENLVNKISDVCNEYTYPLGKIRAAAIS